MPLQDLTPQLRTRLGRVEHTVGVFVIIATLLLLAGFAYYIHHAAQRKGWLDVKARYFTYVASAAGFKVGDAVQIMGMDAGEIKVVKPMAPGFTNGNIYVEFEIRGDKIGYIWDDSRVRLNAEDLLGGRYFEVLKGGWNGDKHSDGSPLNATYKLDGKSLDRVWVPGKKAHVPWDKSMAPYHLVAEESVALTKMVEQVVSKVGRGLPGLLALTNSIATFLETTTRAVEKLDARAAEFGPTLSNANEFISGLKPIRADAQRILANLTNPVGSLGDWLLPTNLNHSLNETLFTTRTTLHTATNTMAKAILTMAEIRGFAHTATNTAARAETNVNKLMLDLGEALARISNLASNLNTQVEANTNFLSDVTSAINHADDLIQGIKRHWLLRSAFKDQEPAKEKKPVTPLRPPKWW